MKNNTNCFFLTYGMSFVAKLRFRLLGRGQPQPHERPLKLSKLCDLFLRFLGVSNEKPRSQRCLPTFRFLVHAAKCVKSFLMSYLFDSLLMDFYFHSLPDLKTRLKHLWNWAIYSNKQWKVKTIFGNRMLF